MFNPITFIAYHVLTVAIWIVRFHKKHQGDYLSILILSMAWWMIAMMLISYVFSIFMAHNQGLAQ